MDLSISIVSWNTKQLLDECLQSVFKTTNGIEFEVVVVDNISSDGSALMVQEKHPQVRVIENIENVGFAKANNQAYAVSTGRHFLLLNPDTVCHNGALTRLVNFLDSNPQSGAVGPLVLNPDGSLQYSWARFPTVISEIIGKLDRRIGSNHHAPQSASQTRQIGVFETDWVGGCCLLIRREAVEQIGLMDESLFMYSEETDWCYRLHKHSWTVFVETNAEIVHLGGQSSSQVSETASRYLRSSKQAYFTKHHGIVPGFFVALVLYAKSLFRGLLLFC
jgi:GT2 family glycosyltransferase